MRPAESATPASVAMRWPAVGNEERGRGAVPGIAAAVARPGGSAGVEHEQRGGGDAGRAAASSRSPAPGRRGSSARAGTVVDALAPACHGDVGRYVIITCAAVRTRRREALQRAPPATLGFDLHARAPLSRRHHVLVIAVAGSIRRPRVTGREVGRVAALWRYPVKSMAPEAIERVEVGWHGIAGDRRWAFVRADQERNGFPWLTIRESPALARYQPRLVDPERP